MSSASTAAPSTSAPTSSPKETVTSSPPKDDSTDDSKNVDDGSSSPSSDSMELRFLIDNQQVGGLIGKAGANVKQVREDSGAYVSILKSDFRTVTERIMVLKGNPTQIARAGLLLSQYLIDATNSKDKRELGTQAAQIESATFKLLIHKAAVGAIIGKSGAVIKETQTATGARVQVSNEPLPNSTEKAVTLSGVPQAVHDALFKIATQLKENPVKTNTKVFNYVPGNANNNNYGSYGGGYNNNNHNNNSHGHSNSHATGGHGHGNGNGGHNNSHHHNNNNAPASNNAAAPSFNAANGAPTSTQKIAIPTVCAGCVIGRAGSVIRDLRAQSGTNISIADPDTTSPNERVVTLTGTPQGIQTAVYLIRQLVEQYQPNTNAY